MISEAGTTTQIERDNILGLVFIETGRDNAKRLFYQFAANCLTRCGGSARFARTCSSSLFTGRSGSFQGCGLFARGRLCLTSGRTAATGWDGRLVGRFSGDGSTLRSID